MFEDTTSDRLDAIQAEIEQAALPASRRQDLEAERQMLTEGATSTGDRELEQARTQAQITGLDQQAKRLQSQISRLERRVSDPSVAPDAMAQSAFKAAASRIQSRQDVLHALTHRSLARYASRVQSGISATGLREMAGRVLTSDNPDEAISGAISDIRSARGPVANHADQVNQAYVDALRQMADVRGDAANNILRNVQGGDSPEIASARQAAWLQTENAPDVSAGSVTDELAQAEAALADVDGMLGRATDDASKETLADIAEERKRAEGTAKAYEAATGCMLRNMR